MAHLPFMERDTITWARLRSKREHVCLALRSPHPYDCEPQNVHLPWDRDWTEDDWWPVLFSHESRFSLDRETTLVFFSDENTRAGIGLLTLSKKTTILDGLGSYHEGLALCSSCIRLRYSDSLKTSSNDCRRAQVYFSPRVGTVATGVGKDPIEQYETPL
ncbi:hypothetical protein TNCV_2703501 [Trichonephila clavipes]|nr:hypothetical protein TNCV_2703501 [Trichonephila clavipes]